MTVTPYERRYRQTANDLLFFSLRVNTHLDWHDSAHWLDTQQDFARLAWNGEGRVAGIMAASAPLSGVAWLRLIALDNTASAASVLLALWQSMAAALGAHNCQTVKVLVGDHWLADLLPAMRFQHEEEIITLRRARWAIPTKPATALIIHPAETEELEALIDIDHRAFAPPWQLSTGELRAALRIAYSCTIARQGATAVGYQLSTRYEQDGHLARLAVLPGVQGQGIGGALVHDLLAHFRRHDVHSVTVNTQRSNRRSQALYAKFGFVSTGYALPVWAISL